MPSDKFKDIAGFVGGLLSGIAAPGMGQVAQNIMDRKDKMERRDFTDAERRRLEGKGDVRYAAGQERLATADAMSQERLGMAKAAEGRNVEEYEQKQEGRSAMLSALRGNAGKLGIETTDDDTPESIMAKLTGRSSLRKEGLEERRMETSEDWLANAQNQQGGTIQDQEKVQKNARTEIFRNQKQIASLQKDRRDLQMEAQAYPKDSDPWVQVAQGIRALDEQIALLQRFNQDVMPKAGLPGQVAGAETLPPGITTEDMAALQRLGIAPGG